MGEEEILFRVVELSLVLVGLILVIFGWIVPYRQSQKSEEKRKKYAQELERVHWEKDFIDKQISQLYGPLNALIIESDIQFSRIQYKLGRKTIFKEGQEISDLPENEQKIWKHYVDTYKIKSQLRMVEIFRDNIHLVYKSEIPTSYRVFLDYSLGWEMLDNQSRNNVPNFYGYHYVNNYPREFNKYIKDTLRVLQQEQSNLIMLESKIYPSTAF